MPSTDPIDLNVRLEEAIDEIFVTMTGFEPHDEDYSQMVEQLLKLYSLREKNTFLRGVNPDTLAIVAGNLLGIVLIVGHERIHVVTSKALQFVLRMR